MWDELPGVVVSFSEQDVVAGATRVQVAVVDLDFVVLGIYGLLNERLLELLAIDHDEVLVLFEVKLRVLVQDFFLLRHVEFDIQAGVLPWRQSPLDLNSF